MFAFPTHIERHLIDAGFSKTEILALRKLLSLQPYTLRELASKTGKSTGVLDQAIKKLMLKKIVKRTHVNSIPKYVLVSVESIQQWVQRCSVERWESMKRKMDDIDIFMQSVEHERSAPEIQMFSGKEGMQKLHDILQQSSVEHLQYFPKIDDSVDEFMQELRKSLIQKRRTMGVQARAIASDTPLGRRFQSRDAYECRKTVLVGGSALESNVEKIISGEFIACIDHEHCQASLIKHETLAQAEKAAFELMWNSAPSA